MKEHASIFAGLVALVMILGSAITMTVHGIKEDALLIILLTGAVEIGKALVGIKPSQQQPTPPSGAAALTQNPDPNLPAAQSQKAQTI